MKLLNTLSRQNHAKIVPNLASLGLVHVTLIEQTEPMNWINSTDSEWFTQICSNAHVSSPLCDYHSPCCVVSVTGPTRPAPSGIRTGSY